MITKRTDIQNIFLEGARTDPASRIKKVDTNKPNPIKEVPKMNLLKRIGLPTSIIGKVLRPLAAVIGIGSTGILAGVDAVAIAVIAATVLVFWITGDMQVAKEFKEIITEDEEDK